MSIYISRGEETSGPYSLEQVQEYLAEGLLLPTDLAWLEGMENWVPLSELVWEAAYPEIVGSTEKKGSQKGLLIGAGLMAAAAVIGVFVYLGNNDSVAFDENNPDDFTVLEQTNSTASIPLEDGAGKNNLANHQLPVDPKAQYKLGEKYYFGNGVEKDSEKAIKWYRKAADQGHAKAQYSLGVMYDSGEGVEEDDEQAVDWYRKAAGQGHAMAQSNLGAMYYNGEGVEKNIRRAYLWMSLAANQEHKIAEKNRPKAAAELMPEQIAQLDKWVKEWSAWKLARGWPENPQASEGPFAALEKKFGFRVHYEGDDIFTGDPNREDNPAKPIEPDELNRLPGIMEKALAKYPPWVVQKYLHRVRWVEDLFLKGENVEGAADHPTRSFYVEVSENNESYSDIEVEVTFHHEFAHILDEEFPFPKEAWRACNPEGFVYKEREDDPGKDLWEKGFVSNYAQSEIDEDFPELTGLIFAEPRKARLLIDNFPRLQAKYRLWLKFYQKIDPDYFTDERFFPAGLIDPDLPHPELVSHEDLVDLNGTYLYLPTGRPYSAKALEYRDKKKTQKKYETLYRDGKEVSESWYFYKDGKLEQKDKYRDDKRISSIFFHPNGEKRREQYYKNGKVDGIVTRWHDNGQKAYGATYRDGKQIEPTIKRWNRDGSPKTFK
jgi:hypothetical protein